MHFYGVFLSCLFARVALPLITETNKNCITFVENVIEISSLLFYVLLARFKKFARHTFRKIFNFDFLSRPRPLVNKQDVTSSTSRNVFVRSPVMQMRLFRADFPRLSRRIRVLFAAGTFTTTNGTERCWAEQVPLVYDRFSGKSRGNFTDGTTDGAVDACCTSTVYDVIHKRIARIKACRIVRLHRANGTRFTRKLSSGGRYSHDHIQIAVTGNTKWWRNYRIEIVTPVGGKSQITKVNPLREMRLVNAQRSKGCNVIRK